jgi:hypothetical protein
MLASEDKTTVFALHISGFAALKIDAPSTKIDFLSTGVGFLLTGVEFASLGTCSASNAIHSKAH